MRVTPKHLRILVTSHKRHLLNCEAGLEKSTCSLMPQIMEMQINDIQFLTRACKGGAC